MVCIFFRVFRVFRGSNSGVFCIARPFFASFFAVFAVQVPDQIGHASSYWRDERPSPTADERKYRIVRTWRRIYDELAKSIASIPLALPSSASLDEHSLASLKRYEDALDALICGWVGIQYLKGRVRPYGDEHAAIWIPT